MHVGHHPRQMKGASTGRGRSGHRWTDQRRQSERQAHGQQPHAPPSPTWTPAAHRTTRLLVTGQPRPTAGATKAYTPGEQRTMPSKRVGHPHPLRHTSHPERVIVEPQAVIGTVCHARSFRPPSQPVSPEAAAKRPASADLAGNAWDSTGHQVRFRERCCSKHICVSRRGPTSGVRESDSSHLGARPPTSAKTSAEKAFGPVTSSLPGRHLSSRHLSCRP